VRFRPRPAHIPVEALPSLPMKKIDQPTIINDQEIIIKAPTEKFATYRLKRYESLLEVAEKYKNVTVKNIMDWNGFSRKNMPSPGDNIKIMSN
jgi:hypothetical protein